MKVGTGDPQPSTDTKGAVDTLRLGAKTMPAKTRDALGPSKPVPSPRQGKIYGHKNPLQLVMIFTLDRKSVV